MLVLASGDHHFDERSRFDECVRVHQWMVELARRDKPALFVSGGDIYHRASTPLEREAVAEWLTAMAEVCPVVISRGNHDKPKDAELMRRLRTRHPILVEERAGVHVVAGAAIATIAWPEPAYLAAHAESSEQASADLRQALQNILRGLGLELAEHDGPRILLGHLMVDGSVTSTGQPLLGQPINVSLTDLALAQAQLGIMGHIHAAQCFDVAGAPHWYTGSPYRTTFGQLETKMVLLAEFGARGLVGVHEIPTPAAPMVHVIGTYASGQLEHDGPDDVRGVELRLRYTVANADREAAKALAVDLRQRWLAAGAAHVQVEAEIMVETRARMPEVVAAASPADKLQAFWTAKGFDPGPRRAPLLEKFAELETTTEGVTP
jgi:DNA repair exonuclease SbcCD nuclease subunit